eukprot:3063248-Pleurochrysis_carterae.AAC.1
MPAPSSVCKRSSSHTKSSLLRRCKARANPTLCSRFSTAKWIQHIPVSYSNASAVSLSGTRVASSCTYLLSAR